MRKEALRQFQLLDEVWDSFSSQISHFYQIGPLVLELNFASATLADKLSKAFDHLKVSKSSHSDLIIRLWDTKEDDRPLPPLNWDLIHCLGYRGAYATPLYLHYFEEIEALSVLHVEAGRGYYIVRDGEALPWWASGSPLQVILHAWLRERGMQLTHAAAIANDQCGVLLTGKGGSGKSTTTLSCLREGLFYLSEDYCIIAPEDSPTVFSVYQSAKWQRHTRKLFPEYDFGIQNPGQAEREKALLYYGDLFPNQLKKEAPIRATISLTVGENALPILVRQGSSEASRDLMLSTLRQLPFHQKPTMQILHSLIQRVEHFHLSLGSDLKANVAAIRDILQ